MSNNRRSYVRIQAEVGLRWRRLDETESANISSTFEGRSRSVGLISEVNYRSDELVPSMRKIRDEHPEIAAWLKFLKSAVESLAVQVAHAESSKTQTIPQLVIISAAGMEFDSDSEFEPGELLEVVLELMPSTSRMMVIGEVVRTDNSNSAIVTSGGNPIALAFKHIRDADQELLIRHIHRAQMEELRRVRSERKAA